MYKDSGEAKLPGVVDYVGGLCRAGEKFIIFAYHLNVLEEIRSVVVKEKLDYMFIAGATPLAERHGVWPFKTRSSAVGVCVWVVRTAVTRPSR